MKTKTEKPFTNPNIFEVNQPAPQKIKKLVFSRILPSSYMKALFLMLFLLFLSPVLLLLIEPRFLVEEKIVTLVLTSLSGLFILFAVLSGIIFAQFKTPYTQSLKEKLGYTE